MLTVDVSFDVDGVVGALERFDRALDRRLGAWMGQALDDVAARAKQTTAFVDRSDVLRNSIGAEDPEGSWSSNNLRGEVAAGAPYAAAIEFGSRPHDIVPKHRKALRWPAEGGFRFARRVRHPGTAPRRFLADALDQAWPDLVAEAGAAVELAAHDAGL